MMTLDTNKEVLSLGKDARAWRSQDLAAKTAAEELLARTRILGWISTSDSSERLKGNLAFFQKGTGRWFLDGSDMLDWKTGAAPNVWICGSGKMHLEYDVALTDPRLSWYWKIRLVRGYN